MASNKEDDTAVLFTYIWAIDNCTVLLSSHIIESPVFIYDTNVNSAWHLAINQNDRFILCSLMRQIDDKGPEIVDNCFEIALVDFEGNALISERHKLPFRKGGVYVNQSFAQISDVFNRRRSQFLSNDTITIRCRIFGMHLEGFVNNICYARTRLAIERKSFIWVIRDFSSIKVGERVSKPFGAFGTLNCSILLNLFLVEKNGQQHVNFSINTNVPLRYRAKISLLDSLGKARIFISRNTNLNTYEEFYFAKKELLMNDNYLYLPFDVLTLRCQFIIADGIASSEIENYRYLPYTTN
ncbi:speckle-type POZ protein B [Nephila pilipes]|uniref:Speckle-type POZ protein B n=1 Tax=Nephila pilipes TaxID=299642 RepID=A0A8X6QFA1_NEPPI|nr:speckle-type POZ protein B [Nephila pilipes]